MSRPVRSLRRTLLTGVLLLVTASLSVSALLGFFSASHEMEELFDARLAQSARITERLLLRYLEQLPADHDSGLVYEEWELSHPDAERVSQRRGIYTDNEFTPYGHEFERNLAFQLLDPAGSVLLRSPSAPEQPLGALSPGFDEMQDGKHLWRTFTLHNEERGTWLIVAERDDERDELAGSMATLTMLPLFITLPLLLILLWWLVTRSISPLTRLTTAIGERHPANLTPLHIDHPPKEVGLLITELNRLMHTLAETLERERQFTDEAAHELRTPLAVLRLYSENALHAHSEEARRQALEKMQQALDRSDRLLRQLLTHARLDHRKPMPHQPLDLRETLRETIASLVPLALNKEQQLAFEADEALTIAGQPTLLDLLFANLVDNAIRYTPRGGTITVLLDREGHKARVRIRDSGPGVPPELLSRLSERFFRVNPQQGDGVGLGMAIVRRIAELHRAEMTVHNHPQGGLEVSVYFQLES